VIGCSQIKMSFKYLGVPLKVTKLAMIDRHALLDKMGSRIWDWSLKKLGYARIVELVNKT